jgi:hypothetical protein
MDDYFLAPLLNQKENIYFFIPGKTREEKLK